MNQAAKKGIIVKSGVSMEKIAETTQIFFDKTGTLTQGEPTVVQVIADRKKSQEILAAVAAIESFSNHVVA
ncbi:HAD family hydrolase, partial [Candidatus Nomurabacteria bacterium]|nr:HAD family hydrolase [Candidatus Nomurabacteria bacterium]